jgi:hypothetical protein
VKDQELWQRLRRYTFPLSSGRGTLEDHLVQKTKLGRSKSARAIEEYRRFLYLAASSGEPVAPSPLIDRLWHTHINDTRAYLDEFCGKVIGRVIHHSPGRAKVADDPTYQRTLDLYAAEFGDEPTHKVWPRPDWLKGETKRGLALFAALLAPMLLSPTVQFPLPFVAWPVVAGVAITINSRYGYWTVQASGDGSGCSSCGSGDGGCGGD